MCTLHFSKIRQVHVIMKSNVSIISFLLVGLPLLAQQSAYTVAFQPIPTRQQPLSSRGSRLSSPNAIISERRLHSRIILASANNSGSDGVGDDVANLRNEIAKMKREAMEKLNILEKATSGSTSVSNLRTDTGSTRNVSSTRNKMDVSMEIVRDEENEAMSNGLLTRSSNDEFIENQNERRKKSTVAASNKVNVQGIQLNNASRSREELSLLCDTTWKVSFSIGREHGTWMVSFYFCNSRQAKTQKFIQIVPLMKMIYLDLNMLRFISQKIGV